MVTIIFERQLNGSLLISDFIGTQLFKRVYYGYSKREALRLFRQALKEEKKKGGGQ